MFDVNTFKELLDKASPGIEQIPPTTVLALERLTQEFLCSRLFARQRHNVVQSVVSGTQAFLLERELDCNKSWLIRRATIKNLEGSISVWVKAWKLSEAQVRAGVQEGCQKFIKKVMEENQP